LPSDLTDDEWDVLEPFFSPPSDVGRPRKWPTTDNSRCSMFANKETLFAKFGQLTELRNSIAHNRTVDEVTRKEGEAAVIWFRQVLGK